MRSYTLSTSLDPDVATTGVSFTLRKASTSMYQQVITKAHQTVFVRNDQR